MSGFWDPGRGYKADGVRTSTAIKYFKCRNCSLNITSDAVHNVTQFDNLVHNFSATFCNIRVYIDVALFVEILPAGGLYLTPATRVSQLRRKPYKKALL